MNAAQNGKKLGTTANTIIKRLRRYGIWIRNTSEGRKLVTGIKNLHIKRLKNCMLIKDLAVPG